MQACESPCGTGYEMCVDGAYILCDAPQPAPEDCGDKVDNDCDGVVNNGCDAFSGIVDDDPTPEEDGVREEVRPSSAVDQLRSQARPPVSRTTPAWLPPEEEASPTPEATSSKTATLKGGCSSTPGRAGTLAPLSLWLAAWFLLRRRRTRELFETR